MGRFFREKKVRGKEGIEEQVMCFVLCHGGWQGGWCWDEVVSQLKLRGQNAYAPTLRGSEAGEVNRAGITLQDIADGLATFLLERDLNDIMLVGHSGVGQ